MSTHAIPCVCVCGCVGRGGGGNDFHMPIFIRGWGANVRRGMCPYTLYHYLTILEIHFFFEQPNQIQIRSFIFVRFCLNYI